MYLLSFPGILLINSGLMICLEKVANLPDTVLQPTDRSHGFESRFSLKRKPLD